MNCLPRWKPIALLAMVAALTLVFTAAAQAETYHLYYLGGQSNMDGFGFNDELPEPMKRPLEDVMIYHAAPAADNTPATGAGVWQVMQPGHGRGFDFDAEAKTNTLGPRFGPELAFAFRLKQMHPDRKIAIVKYSRGGTSIHQDAARQFGAWEPDYTGGETHPGINQYDHFLATLSAALEHDDIDGDGESDTLVPSGILWMQGESDGAVTPEIALEYRRNLKRLTDLIRAAMRRDDLPLAIGRISDSGNDADENDGMVWNYGNTVRAAQEAVVNADPNAALITSTDDYDYSDPYHYDTNGFLHLGMEFADAIDGLESGD